MHTKSSLLLAAAVTGALATAPAMAAFKIRLDNVATGAIEFEIEDNVGLDTNPLAGVITIQNLTVAGVLVTLESSLSKPLLGGVNDPILTLDVSGVSVTAGAHNLRVSATDTGFLGPLAATYLFAASSSSAASGNTATWGGYVNGSNGEFAQDDQIGADINIIGAVEDQDWVAEGIVIPSSPFSLSIEGLISLTGIGKNVQYVSEIRVPEPATMAMLGLGLLGLGLLRRSRAA